MITIFDNPVQLPPQLAFLDGRIGSFVVNLVLWMAIALAAYVILSVVLRAITRRLPGEMDDMILSSVRKPLLALVVVMGLTSSFSVLQLAGLLGALVNRIFHSLFIIAVTWMLLRLAQNAFIPLLKARASQTEKRADDVMIGIVNMIVPVVVIFFSALAVLNQWEVDIGAALAGAGIISLVLGLALQDTLQNIFAGIGLLADEPFTAGELIALPDGKVCKVEQIGLRTTQLYYAQDHSLIFMPNKDLANAAITNIVKPSFDSRGAIEIGVAYSCDLEFVSALLMDIAMEHPNVLFANTAERAARLRQVGQRLAARLSGDAPLAATHRAELEMRRDAIQAMIPRIERETDLLKSLMAFDASLAALAGELNRLEQGGFNHEETAHFQKNYLPGVNVALDDVYGAMSAWLSHPDPLALQGEVRDEIARWAAANKRLSDKWRALESAISKPPADIEMELDTRVNALREWVTTQYKTRPEPWKDPFVEAKGFGASSVDLTLKYFVDDVRLEHYERSRRVATELIMAIHERFKQHNIEIPFPQQDVWIRAVPNK